MRSYFRHLLRWWETTQLIGPDLPATAYLAYTDVHANQSRKMFAWSSVLRHDYALLNTIMQKGLSELHTHLNGASLNFDLQWLSLMNTPMCFGKKCERLAWNKFAAIAEHLEYYSYGLHTLIVMAAEMRRWLYDSENTEYSSRNDNNIFLINGERGAGKTSMLVSMHKHLKTEDNVFGKKFLHLREIDPSSMLMLLTLIHIAHA